MSDKMSGNKGEWSELYAFFRLLSQGRVYAADQELKRIADMYYPILKIYREEYKGNRIDYVIGEDEVEINIPGCGKLTIAKSVLNDEANILLEEIAKKSGSFEVEEVARFANGIKVTKIKAPSYNTTDISMQIEDIHTGYVSDVGFSIKSEMGSAPTLMNAGETTNFIYRVDGFPVNQIDIINSIDSKTKIKDRISEIQKLGGSFTYVGMNHPGFKRNLIMIDSMMPAIIGNLLLYHYRDDVKSCNELVQMLGQNDPVGYGEAVIYEYKFKKFLCACALGMKPGKPWDGIDEANGGYIIVKSDGEILAYHIYNRNAFESYLLNSTLLERASTSRHNYMMLYEDSGDVYIKLNLQIRFVK